MQLPQITHPPIHNHPRNPQNLHPCRHNPPRHSTILAPRLINHHDRAGMASVGRGKVARKIDPVLSRRESVFLGILERDGGRVVPFGAEFECGCWGGDSFGVVVSADYRRKGGLEWRVSLGFLGCFTYRRGRCIGEVSISGNHLLCRGSY